MPVFRPTASSIWSSFQTSGKRHLLLTGRRGIGKTTLLSELFPQPFPGITTWAEPYQAVYMRDNLTCETAKIAEYDPTIQGTEAKMVLLGDVMGTFGASRLMDCLAQPGEWVSIDEIGFLEETCPEFQSAIRELMEKKRVAAVLRKADLPFLNELRTRDDVFLVDLDQPFGNCGCVILASGEGRRFGSNKLMADFLGQPMITRILDATEQLFSRRVVVTRHRAVAELCAERDIPVILHDLPHRSDTVRLGLEAMADADRCMFCPGDQPLLSKDTVAALLLSALQAPDAIWRPGCNSTPGAPVLFPRWAFPELLTLPEGKGGGFVAKKYPGRCRVLEIADGLELSDADTPEMLEQLRRYGENKDSHHILE